MYVDSRRSVDMPNCIHAEKLFRQLHSITMNKLKLLWASKRVECRAHAKLECTRFCCCHLFVDYLSNENEWETSESEQLLDWLLVKFTNLYIFNGISDAGKSYETHENLFKKQRFELEKAFAHSSNFIQHPRYSVTEIFTAIQLRMNGLKVKLNTCCTLANCCQKRSGDDE